MKLYTIGHSITEIYTFIYKLKLHQVSILVDVRTIPYSGRARQFNKDNLALSLEKKGIKYAYRGKNLGGLGENIQFTETIEELISFLKEENIALMCSEGDYRKCHRYTTLTPEFESRGILVTHIE